MSMIKKSKHFEEIFNQPMSELEHLLQEAEQHRKETEDRMLDPKKVQAICKPPKPYNHEKF